MKRFPLLLAMGMVLLHTQGSIMAKNMADILPHRATLYDFPFVSCEKTVQANTYDCTASRFLLDIEQGLLRIPAVTRYATSRSYAVIFHAVNTGPAMLNLEGLGARPLLKVRGNTLLPLKEGDLGVGTVFQIFDAQDAFYLCPLEEGELFSAAPLCQRQTA